MTSRLASILVQDGRVTAKKMADAFQRQVIFGGTLDTILLEMGLVEPLVLNEYLGRATGLPFSIELPTPEATEVVHHGFSTVLVERYHAIPLGRGAGNKLRVMVLDVPERQDPAGLAKELDRPLELVVGPEYRFQQGLELLYGARLLPRFAKIAGKIESGIGKATTGAPTSGPSLFSGRRPQSRSAIDSKPAPAPTPTPSQGLIARPAFDLSTASAIESARPPSLLGFSSPETTAPARRATPAPVNAPEAAGGILAGSRQRTPAPVTADLRPRNSPFERLAAGRQATPAPLVSESPLTSSPAPTLRGIPPLTAEGSGQPPPAKPAVIQPGPRVTAFDIITGPATIEDFVLPEGAATAAAAAAPDRGQVPEPDVQPVIPSLSLEQGMVGLLAATDRDGVLEILCRIARSYFEFAAIYVIHGDAATLSVALGAAFHDRASLRATEVPLGRPSPLAVAVHTLSPYIGQLGDEDVLGETLAYLGRRVPTAGALLPIVIRGRCVAVLHVDDGGREVGADELAGLFQAASETANAFLRLIQAQKKGGAPAATAAPARPAAPRSGRPPVASSVAALEAAASSAIPSRGSTGPAQASGSGPAAIGRPARVSDLPAPLDAAEVERLLQVVENDDAVSGPAAAVALASAPATVAVAVAERFPGLLRFAYRKAHAIGLPLGEHGPLLALAGRLGPPMVQPIIQRLSDSSADNRFYAALVLAELHPEEAVVPLGLRLFDSDPAVRRAAAHALSRIAPVPALTELLDQVREDLGNPDMDRQRAAAAAVGELRDVAAVPKLIDLLTHRDMEVVDLARRALLVITKQDFGTARWRWRSWWEKVRVQSRAEWLLAGLEQSSIEARRSAIDELGVIGTDRLGCHARLSRREREEAQHRFSQWLKHNPDALVEDKSS